MLEGWLSLCLKDWSRDHRDGRVDIIDGGSGIKNTVTIVTTDTEERRGSLCKKQRGSFGTKNIKRTERIYEMIRIKIGVDNGNYNTKSSERMLYASEFAVSDREFITSDMQLFYKGAYYAIGGKRMSFQQEKTKEDDTFILTLPAIANAMKTVGVFYVDVLLGAGLPIDIYGAQKEVFRQYYLRDDIFFRFEEADTVARLQTVKCLLRATLRSASIINSLESTITLRWWTSEDTPWIFLRCTILRWKEEAAPACAWGRSQCLMIFAVSCSRKILSYRMR